MHRGRHTPVLWRAPSWRGSREGLERWREGLERWQETCLGSKGVELFGGPNNIDLRWSR
jgi:hypothetical protein